MNIQCDIHAPVKASRQLTIDAPVEKVWQVLTDIAEWPTWQKSVTQAKLHGTVKEGVRFNWKAGGLPFRSEVHTARHLSEFGWTGRTIGANAVHNWTFRPQNGKTLLIVEESLNGILPRIFRHGFQKTLEQGMEATLKELATACEGNAGR